MRRGLRDLPRGIRSDTPFGMRPDQRPAPAFPGQSFALSRLSRRRGWRELYGQPFEHRLAPIVDAGRARLRASLQQIGQLGIPVLFHEARHLVGPAAAARLANDRQRQLSHVGQSERTVARHLPHLQVLAPHSPFGRPRPGGRWDRARYLEKILGGTAIPAAIAAGVSLYPAAGLAAPGQVPDADRWKKLQAQRFAAGAGQR